jgi:hypothetical protein
MHYIISPSLLNEDSFEYLIFQLSSLDEGRMRKADVLIDLGLTESIDAFALLGTLELGIYLKRNGCRTIIKLPENERLLQFMLASDFFQFAQAGFDECIGSIPESNGNGGIFVKITRIEKSIDIHLVISKIREAIRCSGFEETRGLWDNLIVVVSEISQNIPEHSQDNGFLIITKPHNAQSRKELLHLAVMDLGIGIRKSLDERFFPVFREKWSDKLAIQKTLYEGISRYEDLGRGNGIIRTRELVDKHSGKISIRSGTAKLWGKIPSWEFERFFNKPLTYLPGTQVSINLPLAAQN